MAYDRLQGYLVDLERAGLVDNVQAPTLTARGRKFLSQYREWMATLASYGLILPPSDAYVDFSAHDRQN